MVMRAKSSRHQKPMSDSVHLRQLLAGRSKKLEQIPEIDFEEAAELSSQLNMDPITIDLADAEPTEEQSR